MVSNIRFGAVNPALLTPGVIVEERYHQYRMELTAPARRLEGNTPQYVLEGHLIPRDPHAELLLGPTKTQPAVAYTTVKLTPAEPYWNKYESSTEICPEVNLVPAHVNTAHPTSGNSINHKPARLFVTA